MTDIQLEVGMCERCWGKAFRAAYGIGGKTQTGEYERIVATCACTQAQRLGVDDSFAEGYKAALASQEQRRVDRHDEAIRLLREIASYEPLSDSDGGFINTWYEIETFLAEEPK